MGRKLVKVFFVLTDSGTIHPENIKKCVIDFLNSNHSRNFAYYLNLFGYSPSKTGLEIICNLDIYWLMQISDALELGLSADEKLPQEYMSNALESYCPLKENTLSLI